jgi:hypothetical protein
MNRFAVIAAIALVPSFAPSALTAEPARVKLTATVLDADTGKAIPARMYVRDAAGTWLEKRIHSLDPKGSAVHYVRSRKPNAFEIHTAVSAHPFAVELAPGKYTFVIERGKEYHTLAREVEVAADSKPVEFRLHRWIDMPARGWYSGDTHVHRPLEELPTPIMAEDLNVTFPMTYWVTEAYASPAKDSRVKEKEPGRLIELDKTHVIYPRNTEYEIFTVKKANHMLGAFFVLNHQSILEAGVPPVKPIAAQGHKEGGLIELDKHNWPWTMIIIPVMSADLYELTNNHVWRTEFAITDWAEKDAPYMKVERNERGWTEWGWVDFGLQNYYALLNCGFRLRPTGGTAAGVHPVPVGFGRVYVHLPEGFSYAGWLKGLNEGRSFVTTGPMLFTQVKSESEASTQHVTGTAISSQPLGRIEVLVNGAIVKTITPENRKGAKDEFESKIDTTVKISGTSWVAVRCFEDRPDKRIRFAHSAPVWIDVEGKPLRPRKEEVDWLIKRCADQIERSKDVLPKEALDEYREALEAYRKKAEK